MCDERRPSCQRCIARDEICVGYRDESDIIFRHETEKVVGSLSAGDNQSASSRFQADTSVLGNDVRSVSVARPGDHSPGTALARGQQRQRSSSVDYGRVRLEGVVSPSTTPSISDSKTCLFGVPASLSQGYSRDRIPWLKYSSQPPVAPPLSWSDAQAIQNFFAKYTLVPYDFPTTNAGKDKTGEGCVSQRASQGFLEFLPCTFEEVNVTGRYALRWAVQAAALADVATQDPFSRKQDDTVYASGTQSGAGTGQRALECYGLALSALSDSLGKDGKTPDDYDLMAVVILDIFETLFLPNNVSKGCHAQGMSQILRKRGPEQFYHARGWSLFRLAHHRLQKQSLASSLPSAPMVNELLDHLNDQVAFVKLETDADRISRICARGRRLREQLRDGATGAAELLQLVREMQSLDRETVAWRQGPEWSYATLKTSDLVGDGRVLSTFPASMHIHQDIWTAYEWNYHHTSRIMIHTQLLGCLHRAATLDVEEANGIASLLVPLEAESIAVIQSLTTKIIATVPQMFGDIDHIGRVREPGTPAPRCRAIGAYFLLWPVKIIKGDVLSDIITEHSRQLAAAVFDRIREYTGMKDLLGDMSMI